MKRKFLILPMVFCMLICSLFAARAETTDSGTFGEDGNNLTWIYDDNSSVLTIGGTGRMPSADDRPWADYRNEIREVVIQDGVTNINSYAFWDMDALERVTIPQSVTEIEDYAFVDSRALSSADLPEGLETIGRCAFKGCALAGDVNIPSTVTEIGESAFSDCRVTAFNVSDLNSNYMSENGVLYNADKTTLIAYPQAKVGAYEIPEGVVKINNGVFSGCDKITTLTIPASVTDISNYAGSWVNAFSYCGCESYAVSPENTTLCSENGVLFSKDKTRLIAFPGSRGGEYIIPDEVTWINRSAFAGNDRLMSVVIPGTASNIDVYAFSGCTGLKSVTLCDGVEYLGDSAFKGCTNLGEITIPASMRTIIDEAFKGCTGLKTVTILEGEKALTIMYEAFYGCTNLESITIPANVNIIPLRVFADCGKLSEIIIDDNAACVSRNLFTDTAYYKNEDNWTDGVLYIGNHLAEARLDEIAANYIVRSGTTTIAGGAFMNCPNLLSIAVPSSVFEIDEEIFAGSDAVTDIYYEGTRSQWNDVINLNSFDGITVHCLADEPVTPVEAKVEVTDNSDSRTFTVSVENPRPYSRVYVAVYDAGGTLTSVKSSELNTEGSVVLNIAKTPADVSAKAFLWDSGMRPLCDFVPVDF